MSEPEAMLDEYERLHLFQITDNANEENDIDDETMSGMLQHNFYHFVAQTTII